MPHMASSQFRFADVVWAFGCERLIRRFIRLICLI
jgi:hypothetical protein